MYVRFVLDMIEFDKYNILKGITPFNILLWLFINLLNLNLIL